MNRYLPLAALGLVVPATLQAQAPGYQQLDPRSVRAEYVAEVLDRINDIQLDWSVSWSQDAADELMEQYWEDAVLIPHDRPPLQGHTQIRAFFDEVLPGQGQVEGFMLDFDASGGMATTFGNYMIQLRDGGALRGPMLTVYVRRGRNWRIRTQVFVEPQN